MRRIGRADPVINALPGARGMRLAAVHQQAAASLAALVSTAIPKGFHRFRTLAEADAQRDEALVRVIAANVARRRR